MKRNIYGTQRHIFELSNKPCSGSVHKQSSYILQGTSYPIRLRQELSNTYELRKKPMAVGLVSWIVSCPRERIQIKSNYLFVRAMSSDVTEDSKSFKRISITSNSSLESGGSVAGKELKAESSLSKSTIKYGDNENSIIEQRKSSTENDSESITSYEDLDRDNLISLLLNKNLKLGNFRGIFDIIISPNNLSMA